MRKLGIAVLLLTAVPVLAQHQPYAGQQAREVKSLSAEEVRQYLAGAGSGHGHGDGMKH